MTEQATVPYMLEFEGHLHTSEEVKFFHL